MKKVNVRNKEFKVIPEARLVQGKMVEKGIENDLKAGIKDKYKELIKNASYNYNGRNYITCGNIFDLLKKKKYYSQCLL